MRIAATLSLFLFAALLTCEAQQTSPTKPSDEVQIGGKTIKLPAPAGSERVDGLDAEEDRRQASMLPSTNRYLGRFDLPTAEDKAAGRSFNSQVLRSIESREIGERTFAELKEQTKNELDDARKKIDEELKKMTGAATKILQDSAGADAALSVSDVVVLGYFDDAPSSLGFTLALNVQAQAGNLEAREKAVVASMLVPVNGRLIYLYANSTFKSPEDRAWAEKAVTAWRDVVVAANPRVQGPAARTPLFEGVGKSAVIGAIVGGLATLVMLLFKKKRSV